MSLFNRPFMVPLMWLLALLMTGLLAVGVYLNAVPNIPQNADFSILYASAKSALRGQGLYQQFIYAPIIGDVIFLGRPDAPNGAKLMENVNPPMLTFFTWWIGYFPIRSAYYIWCGLQWLLMLGVLLRLSFIVGLRHPLVRPCLTFALAAYFPVYANMLIGQCGLFITLPIALALIALHKNKDRQAGFWLGIALSLKLFFGLIFIWFLLKKRWTILLYGSTVWTALMAAALLVFGVHEHQNWLTVLSTHNATALSWNAALEGSISRYLGGGGIATVIDIPSLRLLLRISFITLSMGAMLWLARRSPPDRTSLLGLGFCLPLLLLLAPLGWIYYFPLLLLTALILWQPARLAGTASTTLLLVAMALSANPQLITAHNNMHPKINHAFYFGDYVQKDNGEMLIGYDSVFHWFVLPELYTLGLILLCLVPLWCAYKARSTHTGT